MAEEISPVAIGLISDPPTIVLTYDLVSKDLCKRRKRKMPLRDFTDRSNVKRYTFNLRQRHGKYLADIIEVTLEKLLRTIQEIQKGNSVARSLEIVEKEYSVDPDEDLNKLSPAQLAQRKAVMDETFHKNLIKPNDPDFVYDREIKFDHSDLAGENNEWDEESEKSKIKINPEPGLKQVEDATTPVENLDIIYTQTDETGITQPTSQETVIGEVLVEKDARLKEKLEELGVQQGTNDNESEAIEQTDKITHKEPHISNIFKTGNGSGLVMELSKDPNDISSSSNDIEEALDNIESCVLDEDEEDFWH